MTLYNSLARLRPPLTPAIAEDKPDQHSQAWTEHHQNVTDRLTELDLRIANAGVGTIAGDDAPAGYVGEYLTATSGGAIGLTSLTAADMATLALQAGDYDVWGAVTFTPTNTMANVSAWISSTSAAPPPEAVYASLWAAFGLGNVQVLPAPARRVSLAAPATVYLGARGGFTAGTCSATGVICARRVR